MGIVFFDDQSQQTLLPLTFTRPVADLRIGILTIAEKWQHYLQMPYSFFAENYLRAKYPVNLTETILLINGSCCPSDALLTAIDQLKEGEFLKTSDFTIAAKINASDLSDFFNNNASFKPIKFESGFTKITFPDDIFTYNDAEIVLDFALLTKGRSSAKIDSGNHIIGDHFFAEDGVQVSCANINTNFGPVYLGRNAQIFEGANIRGSFALGENAVVKMGAKIYGGTTVGPNCTVAGELKNAVIWGNSAKGHEGYLGNSVLGEWCNLGADTNNSNLKNTYAEVALWDYSSQSMRKTSLQFCGLIMADHVKCSINTMFNTGTVAGVASNVFGAGFPPKFIPDFSWGGAGHLETYAINKALETAAAAYARKNQVFDTTEADVLKHIFEITKKHRSKY